MDIQKEYEIQEVGNVSSDLTKFFYLSFRFSQGSDVLQKHIFKWAAANNLFASVPTEIPKSILEKLKIPEFHEHVGTGRGEFENQWNIMSKVLSKSKIEPIDSVITSLTAGIIGRDIRFVKEGRSMYAITSNSDSNKHVEVFASFVRKYAIFKERTGNVHFDKMFEDVSQKINSNNGDNVFKEIMSELSDLWEEVYQTQKFYPIFSPV